MRRSGQVKFTQGRQVTEAFLDNSIDANISTKKWLVRLYRKTLLRLLVDGSYHRFGGFRDVVRIGRQALKIACFIVFDCLIV